MEALRRAATHLAAAQLLERRAQAANPVLAGLLRERARERRRRGEHILAGLGVRLVRGRPPARPC
ncbi:hypothetical protein [Geodermatophilus amargosae]|uniref:hypothetical protein n=1 Tax=Geodermatophilus amargosae TaxID=1296565 RepID=UPI0034E01220